MVSSDPTLEMQAIKRMKRRCQPKIWNASQKKKDFYDRTAQEVEPTQPAFTRRREAFVGRLASTPLAISGI
jgi:hypothetical protein